MQKTVVEQAIRIDELAPIILFIYNRPQHTERTLSALSANRYADQSELFIFADGPKLDASPADIQNIAETRRIARSRNWCKAVHFFKAEQNKGLAPSVISGITQIIEKYGKVIVLEDDLVVSPWFLQYMNEGLQLYSDNPKVASIHGFVYKTKKKLPEYFFLRGADCWGWATWARAWKLFNPDAAYLLAEIKKRDLSKLFNFNGTYDYTGLMELQIQGKVSSWAVRWYASAFLADTYTLYPGRSYVRNIGMDGSGTHCGEDDGEFSQLAESYSGISAIPVADSKLARKEFEKFFSRGRKFRPIRQLIGKGKRLVKRILGI